MDDSPTQVERVGALAAMRVGNDQPNTLRGTYGDNRGQDTIFGLGAGDLLIGRSAADQLAGGFGPDRLDGNDTLDGGRGEDRIFTGSGFDFVYSTKLSSTRHTSCRLRLVGRGT
jgi:Ca2+-binding RTX toxin-like protein